MKQNALLQTQLTTERLILRLLRPEDEEALFRLCQDEAIARNTARVKSPYTREDAGQWIAYTLEASQRGEEFVFAVLLDGEMAASCGLSAKEDAASDEWELGYWVGAPYRGKGVATEAGKAAIGFARNALGARRITSGRFSDNPASGAVLTKLGLKPTGEIASIRSIGRGCDVENIRYRMDF